MRGRKPKLTALKRLHGSTEPINPTEPIPQGNLDAVVNCPPHFAPDQRAAWEYAVQNSPPGLLKRVDRSVLEAWVVAHCLHRQATEAQSKCGLLAQNGVQTVPSPLLSIINRQAITLMKAASELGFTPSSRPRINVATPNRTAAQHARANDPAPQSLDQYLAGAPQPTVN